MKPALGIVMLEQVWAPTAGVSSLIWKGPMSVQVSIPTKQKPRLSLLKANMNWLNKWNQVLASAWWKWKPAPVLFLCRYGWTHLCYSIQKHFYKFCAFNFEAKVCVKGSGDYKPLAMKGLLTCGCCIFPHTCSSHVMWAMQEQYRKHVICLVFTFSTCIW